MIKLVEYLDRGYRIEFSQTRIQETQEPIPNLYTMIVRKDGINAPFVRLARELMEDQTAFESYLTMALPSLANWIENFKLNKGSNT